MSPVLGAAGAYDPLGSASTVDTRVTGEFSRPNLGQAPLSLILQPAPTSTVNYAGDTFAGTAAASLAGRSSNVGTAATWTVVSGTWQIDGSGGVAPTTATDNVKATLAIPAANVSAFTAEVTSTYHVSGNTAPCPCLMVRYVDANNYWYLGATPAAGTFGLYQCKAGAHTLMTSCATPAGIVDGSAITMRVDIWGRDITCFINGVDQFTYTSSDVGQGSNVIGLRFGLGGSYPTPSTFSNLAVSTYKGVRYNIPRVDAAASTQVLSRGTTGAWDETDINNPTVAWDPPNQRWVLYYSGYSTSTPNLQGLGLAYATSLAGPWTKDAANPAVPASAGGIENGALVWVAGRWLRICDAGPAQTSTDLHTWTSFTPVGITLSNVHDPSLRVNQNGLLELWFGNSGIYKATSTDGGLTWSTPAIVMGTPTAWGAYRGNGEPAVYVPPGREGTELMLVVDLAEGAPGNGAVWAAVTVDGGATWHWHRLAGGSGSGFDSFQKFDACPVYAEGAFHLFHSGSPLGGPYLNLNTNIGRASVQWTPTPRAGSTYAVPYQ